MAKLLKSSAVGKKPVAKKLKSVAEKLHRSLSRSFEKTQSSYENYVDADSKNVPEDVKEGHFAVIAVHGNEPQRFVVPLSCLTHPRFIRLLEQAAEEYGFSHEGALAIPCRPAELERILVEHNSRQRQQMVNWGRGVRCDDKVDAHYWDWSM